MACRTSYHQGRLVVFIQTYAIGFVTECKQSPNDGEVAEGAREVQRGIRETTKRDVRIVKEVWWMGFADSRDKDSIIGMNSPAKAQGGVDHPTEVSIVLLCSSNVPLSRVQKGYIHRVNISLICNCRMCSAFVVSNAIHCG